ncbi:MAG TPA: DUF2277 domain-containing protein [Actinocrinis sp.]|nr:DUF2277 domain-containing protein [Actinocrinis sp.]
MCRNIKKLRPPVTVDPGPEDYRAAALQYVRKVSGFQKPSAANQEAFDRAVAAVTEATAELLATLQVRQPTAEPSQPSLEEALASSGSAS